VTKDIIIILNMEDWLTIADKYRNSVLQLICIRGRYNPFRPQLPPIDRKVSGTGFIIDIANGLVITNAHVVSNAISITGRMMRLGEYDLSLRLISICREKDIALCQLSPSNIATIMKNKSPEAINMIFGDNLLLKETMNVMTIGYPLGQKNVKMTTGVVSGFYANTEDEDEEEGDLRTEEESPSYIQITAPINPGNSGGPLLNVKGEVVGVNAAGYLFSQNVGYAIGSRTVLGVYDALISPLINFSIKIPHVVITPKYAFEHNHTSSALLELGCNGVQTEGIYIKRVYSNSCFDTLEEGDIITHVLYEDIYFNNPQAFSVITRAPSRGTPAIASLDRFGDVTINLICPNNKSSGETGTIANSAECRKLSLKELFDIIPIGQEIIISICRKLELKSQQSGSTGPSGLYRINTIFQYIPSKIRSSVYPRITPYKYLIAAGMSFGELTMNHIAIDNSLIDYSKGKRRYKPVLVINQIFPETTASHTRVFNEASIISEVNGIKVTNIEELKQAFAKSGEYIIITGKNGDKFAIKKEDAIKEDLATIKQFDLPNYQSPFS